jgi:hypothetical protein
MLEIKQFIQQYRTADTPFDYCVSGVLPAKSQSADRAIVKSYATAGATWWIEFVYSGTGYLSRNTERIRYGPPR